MTLDSLAIVQGYIAQDFKIVNYNASAGLKIDLAVQCMIAADGISFSSSFLGFEFDGESTCK